VLLSTSRALAWVFGRLYVANTEFRGLSKIANVFFGLCIAWGGAAVALLPSTCASASARFDFLSGECNHSVSHQIDNILIVLNTFSRSVQIGYALWGIAFCYKYLQSFDGHFRQLRPDSKRAHKASNSAQYLQWQKRRSTVIQVLVPHVLRLVYV
jgi:hypothetical protein